MQLIGYMDSPFVRRVAITLQFLGIDYIHRELSIFRDFEEFRTINPMVKVPTLLVDDQFLVDSNLIIDYLETQVANRSLMPIDSVDYLAALNHIGVAMVAMEKVAQLIYETSHRPEDKQYDLWAKRLDQQLAGAAQVMESIVSASHPAGDWLFSDEMTQADISIAVAWRFMMHIDRVNLEPAGFPALTAFSARAETLPEFTACPLAD